MKCEYCNKSHKGEYGSGRFCDIRCANGFSTKAKRQQINKKVSDKLKGRKPTSGSFKKGYDPNRKIFTPKERKEVGRKASITMLSKQCKLSWNECSLGEKRRRILKEQNRVCLHCKIKKWNNKKLVLELDHIDGNKRNNTRKNLRLLCPNCHSQTENFRKKKTAIVVQMEDTTDLDSVN